MSTKLPPAHHQACTAPHLSSALAPHLLQHRACPKHLQTSRLRTSPCTWSATVFAPDALGSSTPSWPTNSSAPAQPPCVLQCTPGTSGSQLSVREPKSSQSFLLRPVRGLGHHPGQRLLPRVGAVLPSAAAAVPWTWTLPTELPAAVAAELPGLSVPSLPPGVPHHLGSQCWRLSNQSEQLPTRPSSALLRPGDMQRKTTVQTSVYPIPCTRSNTQRFKDFFLDSVF